MTVLYLTDPAHDEEFLLLFETFFEDFDLRGRDDMSVQEMVGDGHKLVIIDSHYMNERRWVELSLAMYDISLKSVHCPIIIYAPSRRAIPSCINIGSPDFSGVKPKYITRFPQFPHTA